MNKRQLGNSDMMISPIGIGTAPMSTTDDWRIYWGKQDQDDALNAIHTAMDLGVNWLDTAPFYGWGHGEKLVGNAIKGKRDRIFIFSKCGSINDGKGNTIEDLSPKSIKREIDETLTRLQTDYIDLYQFHDPDPRTPIEESWGTMQELIQVGKVRYGGLSNHHVDLMQRAHTIAPVTTTQNQYNMIVREIEDDILPYANDNNIGSLAWGPTKDGFLIDSFDLHALEEKDFRRKRPLAQPATYERLQGFKMILINVAQKHDKRVIDVIIAWLLHNPMLTAVILGIRSPKEASEMTGGLNLILDQEDIQAIETGLKIFDSDIDS
jgi:aryl-alcohol dehydrogenase-like predicted oxidoreductase